MISITKEIVSLLKITFYFDSYSEFPLKNSLRIWKSHFLSPAIWDFSVPMGDRDTYWLKFSTKTWFSGVSENVHVVLKNLAEKYWKLIKKKWNYKLEILFRKKISSRDTVRNCSFKPENLTESTKQKYISKFDGLKPI